MQRGMNISLENYSPLLGQVPPENEVFSDLPLIGQDPPVNENFLIFPQFQQFFRSQISVNFYVSMRFLQILRRSNNH